jgi:quercetin dioxygenase-like cupin family protein
MNGGVRNTNSPVRRSGDNGARWDDVDVLAYKQADEAPFRDVTRQVLFDDPDLACEWRYFEVAPGGWSSLERHQHVHAVLILRGGGACLVGENVYELGAHDLVSVPALTWHQFRAGPDEPLGFLCLVNAERDRPQLPTDADLDDLRSSSPEVADFIRS